jgi:hypothetical protein
MLTLVGQQQQMSIQLNTELNKAHKFLMDERKKTSDYERLCNELRSKIEAKQVSD